MSFPLDGIKPPGFAQVDRGTHFPLDGIKRPGFAQVDRGTQSEMPPANEAERPYDLTTVGETMAAFMRIGADLYRCEFAGAESNLAISLARLGHRVRWISRVGHDSLGRLTVAAVAAAGVDVAVTTDPTRPTGVMIKENEGTATRVIYYRRGSAASALRATDLPPLSDSRWLHITGITPALSASCRRLVFHAVERARMTGARISFDVNLRPKLWRNATYAPLLLDLCRQSDLIFVGRDEAEALNGSTSSLKFASELPLVDGQELVFKLGEDGAEYFDGSTRLFEPATPTKVIDTVGAGDAFAAGFLAGTLREWPPHRRLKLGHLLGGRAVGVIGDVPPPLADTELSELLTHEAAAWGTEDQDIVP